MEMSINKMELKNIVDIAIEKFNEEEIYLIERDVSERCICSKFAKYLEKEVKRNEKINEYIVDVEYNRGAKGSEYLPKVLDDTRIVVDLIVHKRGYNPAENGFRNLICIEMKKSTNRNGYDSDEKRLEIMTDCSKDFGYKIGYMIKIDMKEKKLKIKKEFVSLSID